jgi:hypothetical protein
MRLFSFYPQDSDVGETHSLVQATVQPLNFPNYLISTDYFISLVWRLNMNGFVSKMLKMLILSYMHTVAYFNFVTFSYLLSCLTKWFH